MADLEVLFTAAEIERRVRELAAEVDRDHSHAGSAGPILLVGVLKGACIFLSDLARFMQRPAHIDFVRVASYGKSTESSGTPQITKDLEESIAGRDVVLVEDIVDTGWTLAYLKKELQQRGPRSLRIAALLDKPERRQIELVADYVGFEIPDRFVVGYGLDFAENYRNLPDVCVLHP